MIFASLVFVFVFFVLNILSQILIPSTKWKNIAMLAFSLFFYAWTGLRCLLIMLTMVLICKIGAVAIEENAKLENKVTSQHEEIIRLRTVLTERRKRKSNLEEQTDSSK